MWVGYQSQVELRMEFNRMTNEFWGFDFERYYQSGFWDENCIIYSLFDGDRIVSHTTLSILESKVKGDTLQIGQLGTVMTDPAYQRRGLARFLMEEIQRDYCSELQGFFLFANDSVLDFYPKFGFAAVQEYQASRTIGHECSALEVKRVDLDDILQRELFAYYVKNSTPHPFFDIRSFGLTFFYCYVYPDLGFKTSVYYIEALEAMVVAQIEDKVLTLVEVFQLADRDIEEIIQAVAPKEVDTVVFGYTPSSSTMRYTVHKEEDLTLFVSADLKALFEENRLRIPLLAHT